jgi:threonylcarbamoyladenosine tRNA methylthiotransferase MtaB
MDTCAFYTLGCKLNYAETSSIARDFEIQGFTKLKPFDDVDYHIINNCSVTEQAVRRLEHLCRRICLKYPQAKIIAVGCASEKEPERIARIRGVKAVLGTDFKYNIPAVLPELKSSNATLVKINAFRNKNLFHPAYSLNERTRSFLKIQDGCDHFCSFCTIPMLRGKSRSAALSDILTHVYTILENDIKEIVLTGVNIGAYEDVQGNRLIDLLRSLTEIEHLPRIRISSLEPELLTEEIISLAAASPKILPHFHLPLQSASDKILKLMRRKYNRALFRNRIEKIRKLLPDAFIGIDVMPGFPGETQSDFQQTYRFLEDMDFSFLHVFPFSEREKTRAFYMEPKVGQEAKMSRAQILRDLSVRKNNAFYRRFNGDVRSVLFEKKGREDHVLGLSDNYLKVKIPAQPDLFNTICEVQLVLQEEKNVFQGEVLRTIL